MLCTCKWGTEVYGQRIKDVILNGYFFDRQRAGLVRLLRRRPRLEKLVICNTGSSGGVVQGLVDVLGEDCVGLRHLKTLEVRGRFTDTVPGLLFPRLAAGCCPKLEKLSLCLIRSVTRQQQGVPPENQDAVAKREDWIPMLGQALNARMETPGVQCCGLKSLQMNHTVTTLAPLLTSPACETTLEELRLEECPTITVNSYEELCTWLVQCPRSLKLFNAPSPTRELINCLAETVPGLESLWFARIEPTCMVELSNALRNGSWLMLEELSIRGNQHCGQHIHQLMEDLRAGALCLKKLHLSSITGAGSAVVRGLVSGACPLLESLELQHTGIDLPSVRELARALCQTPSTSSSPTVSSSSTSPPPLFTFLRRINLKACSLGPSAIDELGAAFSKGACSQLEYLNLSWNTLTDSGVVHLARALGAGGLPSLREVNLWVTDMRNEGLEALTTVLVSDTTVCAKLEKLAIISNCGCSQDNMKLIVEGLNATRGLKTVCVV